VFTITTTSISVDWSLASQWHLRRQGRHRCFGATLAPRPIPQSNPAQGPRHQSLRATAAAFAPTQDRRQPAAGHSLLPACGWVAPALACLAARRGRRGSGAKRSGGSARREFARLCNATGNDLSSRARKALRYVGIGNLVAVGRLRLDVALTRARFPTCAVLPRPPRESSYYIANTDEHWFSSCTWGYGICRTGVAGWHGGRRRRRRMSKGPRGEDPHTNQRWESSLLLALAQSPAPLSRSCLLMLPPYRLHLLAP
jgi:hypothetical protein